MRPVGRDAGDLASPADEAAHRIECPEHDLIPLLLREHARAARHAGTGKVQSPLRNAGRLEHQFGGAAGEGHSHHRDGA